MSKFNPQPKKGMPPKKAKKPLKRTSIKKRVKKTGEADLFVEMIKEYGDETIHCRCCNKPLYSLSPINFSHVMPKSIAPELRLDKRNIWIVCEDCHVSWETGSRNQPKFDKKRELFEQLKIEINNR